MRRMVKMRLQSGGRVIGTPCLPQFVELNSSSSSEDTTSFNASLVGSSLHIVPVIAISLGGKLLEVSSLSCLAQHLVLQSDFGEEVDLSRVAFNHLAPSHRSVSQTIDGVHITQSSKVDKELTKLLQDIEEVTTIKVDVNNNDDIIEVGNNNQSSLTRTHMWLWKRTSADVG